MAKNKTDKSYVVVVDRNGSIPLRHIVTIHHAYVEKDFAEWYYGEYNKLDGDEFIYCPTRDDLDACLQAIQSCNLPG